MPALRSARRPHSSVAKHASRLELVAPRLVRRSGGKCHHTFLHEATSMFAHAAVAAVGDQACPNQDSRRLVRPAASPLAMRKGCAFPWAPILIQPVSASLEGSAFQRRRKKKSWGSSPERQSLSAQQRAEPNFLPANLDRTGRRPPPSIALRPIAAFAWPPTAVFGRRVGDRRYNSGAG